MSKPIKGQHLRLTLNGKYIAFATDCTLHVSKQLEDSTTKDTTDGMWQVQDVVGKSFDLSASALFSVATDTTGSNAVDLLQMVATNDDPVDFTFEQTEGESNRTTTTTIVSGKVILNDHSIQATNRQNGSYSLQAQGYGALSFGTASANEEKTETT